MCVYRPYIQIGENRSYIQCYIFCIHKSKKKMKMKNRKTRSKSCIVYKAGYIFAKCYLNK